MASRRTGRPLRAKASVGLAVLAEEERRFDLAERHYEEALRLDPDLPSALERFGNLRLYFSKSSGRGGSALRASHQAPQCQCDVALFLWARAGDGGTAFGGPARARERHFSRIRRWTTHGRCCAACRKARSRDARGEVGSARRRRVWRGIRLAQNRRFGLHQQIAVGRAILADPASIGTSTFTYTFPGFRYIEDKWLASVIVAVVDRWGGIDALMAYQIALCALVAAAWFVLLRVWGSGPLGAMFGTSLLLVAAAFRLEPRPDTWSHAFLAMALAILGSPVPIRRVVPGLIVLMVCWVNIHGYFVNGILAIAAAVVAAGCGDPRGPLAAMDRRAAWMRGGALLAGCMAACALHPQGFGALAWPVRQESFSCARSRPYGLRSPNSRLRSSCWEAEVCGALQLSSPHRASA